MIIFLAEELKAKRKATKTAKIQNFSMKPGETKKEFLDRLDTQVEKAVNTALMDTRKIRGKRKRYWV